MAFLCFFHTRREETSPSLFPGAQPHGTGGSGPPAPPGGPELCHTHTILPRALRAATGFLTPWVRVMTAVAWAFMDDLDGGKDSVTSLHQLTGVLRWALGQGRLGSGGMWTAWCPLCEHIAIPFTASLAQQRLPTHFVCTPMHRCPRLGGSSPGTRCLFMEGGIMVSFLPNGLF